MSSSLLESYLKEDAVVNVLSFLNAPNKKEYEWIEVPIPGNLILTASSIQMPPIFTQPDIDVIQRDKIIRTIDRIGPKSIRYSAPVLEKICRMLGLPKKDLVEMAESILAKLDHASKFTF